MWRLVRTWAVRRLPGGGVPYTNKVPRPRIFCLRRPQLFSYLVFSALLLQMTLVRVNHRQ